MQYQRLGRTGHMSSRLILGAASYWECDQKIAEQNLGLALAKGINHIDIAPGYGNAENVAGRWIGKHRDQLFLAGKTVKRNYDEAWRDLENSLKLLHSDTIDLYQFHAVCTMENVEAIFARNGAAKMFLEAREQGLVKWLGITGHGMFTPIVQTEVLARIELDSIMLPVNPRMFANEDYRKSSLKLLQMAADRDMGVIAIKAGAKAPWSGREKTHTPWYEPYDTQEDITANVQFALSQPSVTAVTSAGDVRLLPKFIKAVEDFTPMNDHEQTVLVEDRLSDPMIFDGAEMVL